MSPSRTRTRTHKATTHEQKRRSGNEWQRAKHGGVQYRRQSWQTAVPLVSVSMQAQAEHNTVPEAEVAVTYQTMRAEHTFTTDSFWLQGGSVEIFARLYRGLSAGTNIYAGRAPNNSTSGNGFNLVTYTFGPRYTFAPRRGRAAVFAEVLLGEAQGFNGTFSGNSGLPANVGNGVQSAATSLAFQAGGGIDLRLTHRFAVRAIQAEYLRTQLPNAAANLQQNLRIGAGVVLRIGQ